jgi:hypothetical protein
MRGRDTTRGVEIDKERDAWLRGRSLAAYLLRQWSNSEASDYRDRRRMSGMRSEATCSTQGDTAGEKPAAPKHVSLVDANQTM